MLTARPSSSGNSHTPWPYRESAKITQDLGVTHGKSARAGDFRLPAYLSTTGFENFVDRLKLRSRMWSKVVWSGNRWLVSGIRGPAKSSSRMTDKDPKNDQEKPDLAQALATFTCLAGIVARRSGFKAKNNRRKTHVSRQSPNSRGRKRTVEGPRGIQASDRREVRRAILHNQRGRECRTDLPHGRVGAHRGEAGAAFEFQSHQEKVFEPHQLLRPDGGDRRAGSPADSIAAARQGADQGRSGSTGAAQVSGSAER